MDIEIRILETKGDTASMRKRKKAVGKILAEVIGRYYLSEQHGQKQEEPAEMQRPPMHNIRTGQ